MTVGYVATVNSIEYGFDFFDKEIEIDATASGIPAADLKIACREAEASTNGMVADQLLVAANPVVLDPSGPVSTALTLILQSTWRILSLANSGSFTLGGGNIVNVATGGDVFSSNVLADMINNLSQAAVQLAGGGGAIDPALELMIQEIHAKTEQLIFTKTEELNVNVKSVKDVTLVGNVKTVPIGAE